MSFESLLINTVKIERPSQSYTDGVPTETFTTISTVTKCRIQYVTASQGFRPTEGGDDIIEGWFAFFSYGVNVVKRDKLTDELSRVFIVQTDPEDVTGLRHHMEARLEREEG